MQEGGGSLGEVGRVAVAKGKKRFHTEKEVAPMTRKSLWLVVGVVVLVGSLMAGCSTFLTGDRSVVPNNSKVVPLDNTVGDGDGTMPISANPLNLGNVCANQPKSGTVLLAISRQGTGTNVFQNSATVTVSVLSVTGAGLSAIMTDSQISLPSNWVSQPNNTLSSDTASSTVTLNTSTLGAFSGSISYRGSGLNIYGNTINRDTIVNVTANVINCAPADTTPPVITYTGTAPNANGWNNTDVTVSWSVTDPESPISSMTGCGTVTVTAETSGTTFTCTATSAGGTSSVSHTVKIDKTKPVITGNASPAANSNGWNNTDVTVSFSCAETGSVQSGIDTNTVAGATLTNEGEGQSVTNTGTCTDKAGNTADPATVSGINIDKTAPTITGSATANGSPYTPGTWTNKSVTVSWTCSDSLSGLAGACPGSTTLDTSGADQSVNSGDVCDKADNCTSATMDNIDIDKAPPTIAFVNRTPAPNANGWNNSNVTVNWSCADDLSGPVLASVSQTVSTEGANQSATGTCTDLAGNSASDTQTGINIDKTPPTVSVTEVTNGATYNLGSVPTAGCETTDALSGVQTYATVSVSGGPVVGDFTATCSGATDNAGNEAGSVSKSYKVVYNFVGFLPPVDNPPVFNVAKAGRTIPIKWQLPDGNGGYISDLSVVVGGVLSYKQISCPGSTATVDEIEEYASPTGGTSLRYDSTANQYIFNWQTSSTFANKCYELILKLNDGTQPKTARFKFTK